MCSFLFLKVGDEVVILEELPNGWTKCEHEASMSVAISHFAKPHAHKHHITHSGIDAYLCLVHTLTGGDNIRKQTKEKNHDNGREQSDSCSEKTHVTIYH